MRGLNGQDRVASQRHSGQPFLAVHSNAAPRHQRIVADRRAHAHDGRSQAPHFHARHRGAAAVPKLAEERPAPEGPVLRAAKDEHATGLRC